MWWWNLAHLESYDLLEGVAGPACWIYEPGVLKCHYEHLVDGFIYIIPLCFE